MPQTPEQRARLAELQRLRDAGQLSPEQIARLGEIEARYSGEAQAPAQPAQPMAADPTQSREQAYVARVARNPVSFFTQPIYEGINRSDDVAALGARADNFFGGMGLYGQDFQRLDPAAVRTAERERLAQARQDRPLMQMGREAIGSLPLAAIPGGASVRGAAGLGAAFGALAGTGDSDTAGELAEDATVSGGIGGAAAGAFAGATRGLGAMAGPVVRGLEKLARGAERQMTTAQRRAVARLMRAGMNDGLTREAVRQRLVALRDQGITDQSLVDLGGPQSNLAQEVARAARGQGPARNVAMDFLEARLNEQAPRVSRTLSEYIDPSGNYRQLTDDLVRQRADNAAPMYAQVFGPDEAPNTLPREQISEVLARLPQAALRGAREIARSEGRTLDLRADTIPLRDLAYIKQGLDDLVFTSRTPTSGVGPSRRRAYAQVRRELLDAMPENYRAANAQFASDTALREAAEVGRMAFRGDAEDLQASVASMGESELEMFRAGLVRALRERANRTNDASNQAGRLLNNQELRDRVRPAFGSEDHFQAFLDAVEGESQRVQVARGVAPSTGSPSADRLEFSAEGGGALLDAITGNLRGAATRVARGAARMLSTPAREARDEAIVRLSTQPLDARAQEAILQELEARMGPQVANEVRQIIARGAPVAGIAAANQAQN